MLYIYAGFAVYFSLIKNIIINVKTLKNFQIWRFVIRIVNTVLKSLAFYQLNQVIYIFNQVKISCIIFEEFQLVIHFIVKQVNSESSDFVLDSSGKYVQYDNVNDPGYRAAESPVPDSARSSPVSVGNASVGKNIMITYACNENCNYYAKIKYCLY